MRYLTPKNRAILREMVATDFKIRYQGSVLGYVWSVLKPLMLFGVLYVLFTYIFPMSKGVEHFGVSLLIGIVLWNFFAETTMVGAGSVVAHGDLIRKVAIPRYLVVVSSSISALINLGLSLIVVVAFAVANGILPQISWLGLLPIILEIFVLSIGVAFILATAYVKFRDITYIWEVVLQVGFYASAIIMPLESPAISTAIHKWFFLNPIVQIVQDARYFMIQSSQSVTMWNAIDNPLVMVLPFIIITVICTTGFLYFRHQSRFFAEDI